MNTTTKHLEATMSNNKQSSVEKMFQEMLGIQQEGIKLTFDENLDLLHKYKAMHKEEIVNTIVDCEKEHIIQAECYPPQFVLTKAEHYYNETFNND